MPLTLSLVAVLAFALIALATHSDMDFQIDGDWEDGFKSGTVAVGPEDGGDWDSVIPGPADLIVDPTGNSDTDIFKPSGKFGNPAGWSVQGGTPGPSQNDLTNIMIYGVLPGAWDNHDPDVDLSGETPETNDDVWIVMGMERTKANGTFDLDFEFNQDEWDGTSGTLTRTKGDVVVAFELKGNPTDPQADLEVIVLVYDPNETLASDDLCTGVVIGPGGKVEAVDFGGIEECPSYDATGFEYRFRGPASALGTFGEATMNALSIPAPPWGSVDDKGNPRTSIPTFQFAEAKLNLTALGIAPECPGFGSAHAKSRSSLEATSDLKDLAGPIAPELRCSLFGHKFNDKDADGTWDKPGEPGLADWTIELYEDDGTTPGVLDGSDTLVGTEITADSNGDDPLGFYEFADVESGTYFLVEVCKTDWIQSLPSTLETKATCDDGVYGPITLDAANVLGWDGSQTSPFDFGNYRLFTKSGTKYHDLNADGDQDTGELGLAGWVINAYADTDGNGELSSTEYAAGTAGTSTTADGTGADPLGSYSMDLKPGKYVVVEVLQLNWLQSEPTTDVDAADASSDVLGAYGYPITLVSQQTDSGNDFGNYQNATISGVKYKDADNNGDRSGSLEVVLNPWTIRIYEDDGDGALDADDTLVFTDTDGSFSFAVEPGTYFVCEVGKSNWSQTEPTSNTICNADDVDSSLADAGYKLTVTSGQSVTNRDFGNTPLSDFDVRFFDLTGSTDATISCVIGNTSTTAGSITTDSESASPELVWSADDVVIGTYVCTITIVDP